MHESIRRYLFFMRTTISKKRRVTIISFNEADPTIRIITSNTSLKKRLLQYASRHPEECQLLPGEHNTTLTYNINKGRFGFKLTSPYSDARRASARGLAKGNLKKLHPPA